MAAYKTRDIEGIGPKHEKALAALGITRTDHLLSRADTRSKRRALAKELDVTPRQVLEWANRADLMRVHRVGPQLADLLERAGVDSVAELATRNPTNLHRKLSRVRAETSGTTAVIPGIYVVGEWIDSAASIPRIITH